MTINTEILSSVKLIVGLGNIGDRYKYTRHNAGFMFLEKVAQKPFLLEKKFKGFLSSLTLGEDKKIWLLKPTTLMNASGESVLLVSKFFTITSREIIVVHDDLDLNLGKSKLQFAKGPLVHGGIMDIEKKLRTNEFYRYRIGVDSRPKELRKKIIPNLYVLSPMSKEELEIMESSF